MQLKVILILLLSLISFSLQLNETKLSVAKPNCQEKCGNITVPFPFGIGEGCYQDKPFEVICIESRKYSILRSVEGFLFLDFLPADKIRVHAKGAAPRICNSPHPQAYQVTYHYNPLFGISHTQNRFVAVGCDLFAYVTGSGSSDYTSGCASYCGALDIPDQITSNGFPGRGYCKTSIPKSLSSFNIQIFGIPANKSSSWGACQTAFLVEKDYLSVENITAYTNWIFMYPMPIVLEWVIGNTSCHEARSNGGIICSQNSHCVNSSEGMGYNCECLDDYTGNPYLPPGCQACRPGQKCKRESGRLGLAVIVSIGTGTAGGVLILFCVGVCFHYKLQEAKKNKMKQKYFKRNGGLLLQQQISSSKESLSKTKFFTTEEMEKATDNFKESRVLGKGGHGTVYKGMLPDGTIVAVKKSNIVNKEQVGRFLNEVHILSQINHRNIVKLLGCCLEYEAPLLVYEYVSNDTLSHHLHDKGYVSTIPWKDRLRIAAEVAEALAYLHSYASTAIFHRDIKSNNILLDENYRVVVSDFGLSKSIAPSETHLTTLVWGTFGYLDPEYFRSGQLTDKSDVYAFGVVLIEILTGRRAVSSITSDKGLVVHFQLSLKHDRLFEIVETLLVNEGQKEEVLFVAKLAKRCLKLNVKKGQA